MIFGVQHPAFKVGSTQIDLNYAVVMKDEPVWNVRTQESEIDFQRSITVLNYYWIYKVKIFLYKYANPTAKLNELMPYLFSEVNLLRHIEHTAIENSNGQPAKFVIEKITPIYLKTSDYKDGLIILFKSEEEIDITNNLIAPNLNGYGNYYGNRYRN